MGRGVLERAAELRRVASEPAIMDGNIVAWKCLMELALDAVKQEVKDIENRLREWPPLHEQLKTVRYSGPWFWTPERLAQAEAEKKAGGE